MTGAGIATLFISVLAVGEIILSYSAKLKKGYPAAVRAATLFAIDTILLYCTRIYHFSVILVLIAP